ncbi:MAG: DUF3742 family protein [Candidatus Accumulibacter sp.]|jgi:hypothetical protein|nr:DUF3742 family protein [Accumulibacter sp.]
MNTAKSIAPTPFSERAGRALGRTWRASARLERKASGWLVARGMNANLADDMLWLVKLAALGLMLYAAFWVALLLGFAVLGAWAAGNAPVDDEEDKAEWRFSWSGYGLYHDEMRVDPGYLDDDD